MFSFTTNPIINIVLDGQESRAKKTLKVQGQEPIEVPLYSGQENISGVVDISVPPGKKVEHQGIRVELIGQTELYFEKGNPSKFTALVRELEGPNILTGNKSFKFDFSTEKPYETYSGMNVRLRYFVRVTITRSYSNCVKEQEFAVQNFLTV
eukprot:gene9178-11277_t